MDTLQYFFCITPVLADVHRCHPSPPPVCLRVLCWWPLAPVSPEAPFTSSRGTLRTASRTCMPVWSTAHRPSSSQIGACTTPCVSVAPRSPRTCAGPGARELTVVLCPPPPPPPQNLYRRHCHYRHRHHHPPFPPSHTHNTLAVTTVCASHYHIGISQASLGRNGLAIASFTEAITSRTVPNRAADIRCIHERAKALQMSGNYTEVRFLTWKCVCWGWGLGEHIGPFGPLSLLHPELPCWLLAVLLTGDPSVSVTSRWSSKRLPPTPTLCFDEDSLTRP